MGREENWRQLASLVEQVEESGVSSLSAADAQRLPLLYRLTVSSLSVARGMVLDRNLLLYLENLALRAYLVVYGPRIGLAVRTVDFVKRDFPCQVRSIRFHLAFAAFILFAAVYAGYLMVMNDANMFYLLVPGSLMGDRGPDASREELRTGLFVPFPGFVNTFVIFATSLIRHNALVGILSFGLGFVAGLPTILLLAHNGLTIGAMTALYARQNLTSDFLGWLLIHGVTEILAILLCAAAGFVLAEKLIFPGPLPRLTSLARNGRIAASVVAGAVGMFFVAGILEGGFRQLINNTASRYVFVFLTAGGWLYYFATTGKGGSDGD